MPQTINATGNRWLHRFALLTAFMTLVLLAVGGLVTSHGAGMAVPDWPNTYGYNLFLFPISQWVGGILYEHSHRLVAAFVGCLTAILAVWLWGRETRGGVRWIGVGAILFVLALMGIRVFLVYVALVAVAIIVIGFGFHQYRQDSPKLRWLGMIALAAVILQGVLGGMRVVLYKDAIGIFHATLAQLFFVLVCAIALLTSRWWQQLPVLTALPSDGRRVQSSFRVPGLGSLALFTTGLILFQLILGATMRHQHAGLAIPDFPLAYGELWPAMDADSVTQYNQQRLEVTAANPITAFQIGLQMAHRLLALGILIAVALLVKRSRRRGEANHADAAPVALRVGGDQTPVLRRLALAWLVLILIQVGLGAVTIWTNKAADMATAHVLVGALSLVTGVLWCIISFRSFAPAAKARPATASFDALHDASFDARTEAVINK